MYQGDTPQLPMQQQQQLPMMHQMSPQRQFLLKLLNKHVSCKSVNYTPMILRYRMVLLTRIKRLPKALYILCELKAILQAMLFFVIILFFLDEDLKNFFDITL